MIGPWRTRHAHIRVRRAALANTGTSLSEMWRIVHKRISVTFFFTFRVKPGQLQRYGDAVLAQVGLGRPYLVHSCVLAFSAVPLNPLFLKVGSICLGRASPLARVSGMSIDSSQGRQADNSGV
jgi:hypothetical protein